MLFDFSSFLNLPLIWGGIIAMAIFLYVLLDGFVLGVGIIFPFTPTARCKDGLINSIAPFWDANQTWLVFGGGGMLAAFPLAYSALMGAFYVPVIAMLLGLIFRGAAFEFRYKESRPYVRQIWSCFFHFGSVWATFCQGCILGGYVEGIAIEGRAYVGGPFDWASAFSILVGIGVVFGAALLGATWSILKTEGELQQWARQVAAYCSVLVCTFMIFIAIFMPSVQERIWSRWFDGWNIIGFLFLASAIATCFLGLWRSLWKEYELQPFLFTIGLFLSAYLGLGVSMYPWIVPYHFNLEQASAATTSLSLMLVGVAIVLPCILGYTAYTYRIFWGKTHYDTSHS